MFSDTAVTTTHFLKKCIQVPKVCIEGEDKEDDGGLVMNKEEGKA